MTPAPLGAVLAPLPALWRVHGLRGFFPEARTVDCAPVPWRKTDVVLGWGDGVGARYAIGLAAATGATYLRVDPGFIASVGGPSAGASPLSLLAEPTTIRASGRRAGLEAILGRDFSDEPALLDEARDLMVFKREHGLSRYNAGRPLDPGQLGLGDGRQRVLVVDEPEAASSPKAAGVFAHMLASARADHPGARIIVVRRPGGRRTRTPAILSGDDILIDTDVDLMALIALVDAVYVGSSLVGLDALLAGKPVVCFGDPFFAGWGLTDDRSPTAPQRARKLAAEALFAGAYLLYPRYVDPLSGEPCTPGLAFERLATFKQHARRVAGHWVGLNIPPPKHPVLSAFLAGPRSSYAPSPRWSRRPVDQTWLATWASKPNAAVRAARVSSADRMVNIEDGFLRSVGLGSNFHPAASLVLDRGGIYYDPTTESDLERILNHATFAPAMLERARRLREEVVQLGLSKYNLALSGALGLEGAAGRRILLVPGQVEDDASVRTGGQGWTNLALLTQVRARNPDAFILFKEHPDVTAGNRVGRVAEADVRRLANLLVRDVDIIRCIESVDEVHTLTSLTGFEALLRGKRVATYGAPFYGGWGLTDDLQTYPRARRSLSLDELVAGVLLLYPLYVDPISRLPCDAATFVQRLKKLRAAETVTAPPGFIRTQLIRGYRASGQVLLARRVRSY